ncbi:MAG TPA: hypothetical protein VJZ75_05235 [Candidatus Bathyarchaeia archaeon]|nr:hypothetical protein [Candidatus Bathyarchaeia archaeon]
MTHLHRLSGLPSVWGSCTIASLADATAANLTALAQHSLGQLDHVASQGFTLGPSNRLPNIAPLSSFGPKPTYRYSRSVHRLMTMNTYARLGEINWIGT